MFSVFNCITKVSSAAIVASSILFSSAPVEVSGHGVSSSNGQPPSMMGSWCNTMHEEYVRRQLQDYGSETPFDETSGTKHVPYITVDGTTATVVVGNGDVEGGVWHPMVNSDDPTEVHFITHMYVVDQDANIIAMKTMDPALGGPATMTFEIPAHTSTVTAYEWCNLHGLWVGPTVAVTPANDAPHAECTKDNPLPNSYGAFAADFVRLQQLPPFISTIPYSGGNNKHTPFITLKSNFSGEVCVGVEGLMHPMKGNADVSDGEDVHWITDIYVLNQDQNIVAMKSLDPSDVDTACMDFIFSPEDATELTAYSWCNIHGLWIGPTVKTGGAVAGVEESAQTESTTNATETEADTKEAEDDHDHDHDHDHDAIEGTSGTTSMKLLTSGFALVLGYILMAIVSV